MRKLIFLSFVLLLPAIAFSQEEEKKWGIKFHGFVKTDIIYDSRQSVAVREGHFHLYPKPELIDSQGDDINAQPYFNILSIQTRLKGVITGPDVLGAKSSALIEGAFFGHSADDVNGFRLRHAFAKLTWTKTELLVGQYWHPMFITDCFPGTVSFNTGAPFQPFTRNPQVRLSHKFGNITAQVAAMSQRDFTDAGVNPASPGDLSAVSASSFYLRNAVLPELNLTLQYQTSFGNTGFLFGLSGNYKKLSPRLESEIIDKNSEKVIASYKSNENVEGMSGMAFMKLKFPDFTFKAEAVLGQCTYGWTMLGGYVAQKLSDPDKMFYDFEPLDVFSMWTDIHTNGNKWQLGIFAAYSQNWGASSDIKTNYFFARGYSSGNYINYLYRISPRVMYNVGKMRFACETEYTSVNYGKTIDSKGVVHEGTDVANLRLLLAVYYFF